MVVFSFLVMKNRYTKPYIILSYCMISVSKRKWMFKQMFNTFDDRFFVSSHEKYVYQAQY